MRTNGLEGRSMEGEGEGDDFKKASTRRASMVHQGELGGHSYHL